MQIPFHKAIGIGVILILAVSASLLLISRQKTPHLLPESLRCPGCNIVFVSFDTLRADHVHALGYGKDTTPTLDSFARRGFSFTHAVTVASWTLPSTMSWFTGVYPSTHKVINKYVFPKEGVEVLANLQTLSPDMETLAEVLKTNGYTTGGFTGGSGVDHEFGFNAGFDEYTDGKDFGGFSDTVPKALEWITRHKNEKLFVFLHGYDIHGQFVPADGYDRRFVDFAYKGQLTGSKEEQKKLRDEGNQTGKLFLAKDDVRFLTALYDEKIQRADETFSGFVRAYEAMGLMSKTVFIITSDHGEELYEHGRIDHGHSLYDELIRIPLIVSLPKTASLVIPQQVRSIDIMPTLLELIEASQSSRLKQQMQGTSLLPFMAGQKPQLDIFPETDYLYITNQRAVRTWDEWKLITIKEGDTKELYNLRKDPDEQRNQVLETPQKATELKRLLDSRL